MLPSIWAMSLHEQDLIACSNIIHGKPHDHTTLAIIALAIPIFYKKPDGVKIFILVNTRSKPMFLLVNI